MRVLITGGAGFIGSAIARAYVEGGARVFVVDNLASGKRELVPEGAELIEADIRDRALEDVFERCAPLDVVSHHAALKAVRKALLDPRGDAEVNILGTLNVLRCSRKISAGRVIFASSAALYGDAESLPISEQSPALPISPYGISKAAAEAYCAYFARSMRLPAVALRYSTVYGPAATEESEAGVITIFARQMLSGRRPTIYGDGEQTRDLVWVGDVVRANLLAAERAPFPWAVYNVATGVETTINQVYWLLASIAGYEAAPSYAAAKPGEVRRNVQANDLIRRELGWMPEVSLRDGLAQVVAAYRAELAVA